MDGEVAALLLIELDRHLRALEPGRDPEDQRRAAHAIRGSTGMAGLTALSEALGRFERRLGAGDDTAAAEARELVIAARAALAAGEEFELPAWPTPPPGLVAPRLEASTSQLYAAEMHDRLAHLDAVLASTGGDREGAAEALRHVHTMKGAALALGDEATAWFCHGLEERLRHADRGPEQARDAIEELARSRGVLAELLVAPGEALDALRRKAAPPPSSPASPGAPAAAPPPRRAPLDPADATGPRAHDDASLRVPTATLDRLFERVRQMSESRTHVTEGASEVQHEAAQARTLRRTLLEALRLIGPPRPWGAPVVALAAIERSARELGRLGDRLEGHGTALKDAAERVRSEAAAADGELAQVRTTTAAWLFDRIAGALAAQARREGREVRIACLGGETPIERRVAEALLDPVLQLAHNAVAHGIEPAAERAARGKTRVGTVRLRADPRGGGLRLHVEDDGAGVDLADLRSRAVARGAITPEAARGADDETLLGLLFAPGFTTRDSADLLSGRGVGLDLALAAVRRLGGTIRLASRPGRGLTATLDVPLEGGLTKVLWVTAARSLLALPVLHIARVHLRADRTDEVVELGALLGAAPWDPPAPTAVAIELDLRDDAAGGPQALLGVEAVGAVEEVTLRGVSSLVMAAGPYVAAIVRGDALRLCLDAAALGKALRPGA